ncbi:MAG: translocation/assembly module TamB [Muribaculaceae bacterium]|nr:translocation/assembly module TamB [Muribaculaceae bacterium]
MKNLFRVLRAILVTAIVLPLALPVLLYIALSFDSVRASIASTASSELTKLLGTEVEIGGVEFAPFNRIVLRNVVINDTLQRRILSVNHLGAGISLSETLWQQRPVITYAELLDVDIHLCRDSLGAPLNIEPIINRFKKQENTGPSAFDLTVNMVVMRRSSFHYDILSEPEPTDGTFDPNHISISDLRADIRAPRIKDSRLDVEIKRLGAFERSGLIVSNFSTSLLVYKTQAFIDNLILEMPGSKIALDNLRLPSPLSPLPSPDSINTRIATLPDTYISTKDLYPLLPEQFRVAEVLDVTIAAEGTPAAIALERLSISLRDSETHLDTHGKIEGLTKGKENLKVSFPRLSLNVSAPALLSLLSPAIHTDFPLQSLSPLGRIDILGAVEGSASVISIDGSIVSECGDIDLNASLRHSDAAKTTSIDGVVNIISFNPSALHPSLTHLTEVNMDIRSNLTIGPKNSIIGTAETMLGHLMWKGNRFSDISAEAIFTPNHVDVRADSHSPGMLFSLTGGHDLGIADGNTEIFADLRGIELSRFLDGSKFQKYIVSSTIDGSISGLKPDEINGWLKINNLRLASSEASPILVGDIDVEVMATDSFHTLTLSSKALDVDLQGNFSYPSLGAELKAMANTIFPALVDPHDNTVELVSDAYLNIKLKPDSIYNSLLNLPVEIIQPISLLGAKEGSALSIKVDVPYLLKKDKLIEQTALNFNADAAHGVMSLSAVTQIPTKDGMMDISLQVLGGEDSIKSHVNWKIDRDKDFHGNLNLSANFAKNSDHKLHTTLRMHPSELVFNDSSWYVNPAVINVEPQLVRVENLGGYRRGQSLNINGTASPDSLSRLVVDLDHIDLDYIFETLAISDAVMFGGIASGKLYGDALLSKSPVLYTPRLHVDGIAYNNCVMGDADIVSWWDNNTQKVTIKADIKGEEGESKIDGYIRPASEELVFNFAADCAPVGFMLPFMSAFTSSISGHVSGDALLYGTFKDLDVKGKIFVDNLKMKLDFTNTSYTVTDSVTLNPGRISFSDVTLKDRYGQTAKLSGVVTHHYFHEPTFSFYITDARDMLVYDVAENDTPDPWFGSIFGRGSAQVRGVPGRIDIGVTMSTEPKSTFTFVLSDSEQSIDYDFITFRDRDKARKDSLAALDPTPEIIKAIKANVKKQVEGPPSQYVLDFNVDITPQATLNLIMDPVGGDKIVAHGSGHLGMKYDSQGELEMRGDYTLNRGSYSFTLQDIILKDFTIREGSRISFSGDPYAAQLDITAAYTTKANLTDLDESFLQDPELNRTNVNVNAIMHVTGDMRSPDISYDLEFPSLTSDIDRKVKSIISTEEMMSQQIIYLLALNRFYTPDYMSATHGNELVSVASSTLSSRLGSMLGALSDNWSIAPSINSSKGDFSDVEVDLALSSQLLDNRLLFNGNLGYRDKSLNNNTFIGDFDIRYLLNRRGTIQLKAYNRYNDQNYYLKSALTTQGIGIVFKRDFDNIFSFLRPHRKKKETEHTEAPADTTEVDVKRD